MIEGVFKAAVPSSGFQGVLGLRWLLGMPLHGEDTFLSPHSSPAGPSDHVLGPFGGRAPLRWAQSELHVESLLLPHESVQ